MQLLVFGIGHKLTANELLCHHRRHGDQAPAGGCHAQLLVFGSFCSSLYHKGSDLDLTITGRWRNRHGQLLEMVRVIQIMQKCIFMYNLLLLLVPFSCVCRDRDGVCLQDA
jgi:hypothetical protein